jgi:hypothetical protein
VLGWGLVGLVLIGVGLGTGLDLAARAETLVTSTERSLAAASVSTRRAADALEGVGEGIGQARDSAVRAASLAGDAGETLDGLANSMSVSIFGTQPFLPLAADFMRSADEAEALADELSALGDSLAATGDDTALLTAELGELAAALEASGDVSGAPPVRLALGVTLLWIALPTIGALVVGGALATGRSFG